MQVVSLESIVVNPSQPRRSFAFEELEELAQSIREVGILHPPLTRLIPTGKYELISGERRFRAAKLAGLEQIPILVCQKDHFYSAKAALIENVQRVDLNPLDIAKALRSLLLEHGLNQDELAKQISKKRSTVANYLRLLSLPPEIQQYLSDDRITMGHAKAILSLSGNSAQLALAQRVMNEGLSVRQTEDAAMPPIKKMKKVLDKTPQRDLFLDRIAQQLMQRFGTKVEIVGDGASGKIVIDYYNYDDLDRLIEIMGE